MTEKIIGDAIVEKMKLQKLSDNDVKTATFLNRLNNRNVSGTT